MKKSLAFIIGASLLILPSLSFAQVSTTTATSSDSVRQQLIHTLLALVQQLEAQIAQIIATQQQQGQTLSTLAGAVGSSTVAIMTTSNAPASNQAVPAPACVPNPQLTFTTNATFTPKDSQNFYAGVLPFSASYTTGCPIDIGTTKKPGADYYTQVAIGVFLPDGTDADPQLSGGVSGTFDKWTLSKDNLIASVNGDKLWFQFPRTTSTTTLDFVLTITPIALDGTQGTPISKTLTLPVK